MNLESTNFSLNDDEFLKIKEISNNIDSQTLILFWKFALKTLEELDLVSNQNLSIEMFLIRLMYLKSFKFKDDLYLSEERIELLKENEEKKITESEIKNEAVNQIKNVVQEKKANFKIDKEIKAEEKNSINSFNELLNVCSKKKEIKLKYELEKNVNLVSFEKNRIEITFNEDLDKNFVKDLSLKLFEWTGYRWIITFSKIKGDLSIKDKEKNKKIKFIDNAKQTRLYKTVIEKFPDANLIDVNLTKKED